MHRLQFITQLFHHPDAFSVLVLLGIAAVGAAALYLLSRVDITILVVTALALELFSGNWSLMGIPVPLDRVVLLLALCSLLLKGARNIGTRRLTLRPLHLALLTAVTWCAISGLIAGTLTGHLGFYAFLDRFGVVPFLLFCLAPIFFGSPRQRKTLLVALVGVGLYLGFTGCMEGLHVYKLVFPRYIANPNLGIQFGRARGPILESTGDGFVTFVAAVASAIGLLTWTSWRARLLCALAIALDAGALFFTLTRSVWIGTFIGVVGAMLLTKQSRRILAPLLLTGFVAVAAVLAVSPSIRAETIGRAQSQSPVWDRQNTDLAALRIIKEYPLTGVGWEKFVDVSINYMEQQPGYPITGQGIEVHNVFLSHAAELGIPGLLLWLLAFGGAVRRGLFPGRLEYDGASKGPPDRERQLWRAGGVAVVLCFFVIADLAPFSQALPNSLLWTWLGILAAPYTSVARSALVHGRRSREAWGAGTLALPQPGDADLAPVYL